MSGQEILRNLEHIIQERHRTMPAGAYTTELFSKGSAHIRRKIIEEAGESVTAESQEQIIAESADLIYHLMVYWEEMGISFDKIINELARRMPAARASK